MTDPNLPFTVWADAHADQETLFGIHLSASLGPNKEHNAAVWLNQRDPARFPMYRNEDFITSALKHC